MYAECFAMAVAMAVATAGETENTARDRQTFEKKERWNCDLRGGERDRRVWLSERGRVGESSGTAVDA
jgi:hypothetical protein